MKKLKNAGIALIVSIAVGLLSLIYLASKIIPNPSVLLDETQVQNIITSAFPLPVLLLSTLLSIILLVFIYAGFVRLGEISKNRWLKNWSWTVLIILIVSTVKETIFTYLIYYKGIGSPGMIIAQGITNIFFLIVMAVAFIFFGIGLLKSQHKIPMAKLNGIMYIISGAGMIIIIGSLVLFVAQIISIIMFFKASKKFEK